MGTAALFLGLVLLSSWTGNSEATRDPSRRKLMAECHMDLCGIWCGPARGPPCSSQPPAYNSASRWSGGSAGNPSDNSRPGNTYDQAQMTDPSRASSSYYASGSNYYNNKGDSGNDRVWRWPAPTRGSPSPTGSASPARFGPPPAPGGRWQQKGNQRPAAPSRQRCNPSGSDAGLGIGQIACDRVATECLPEVKALSLVPLLSDELGRICNEAAAGSCISSAQEAVRINGGCAAILRKGTDRCSASEARLRFIEIVNQRCTPDCESCARPEEGPFK